MTIAEPFQRNPLSLADLDLLPLKLSQSTLLGSFNLQKFRMVAVLLVHHHIIFSVTMNCCPFLFVLFFIPEDSRELNCFQMLLFAFSSGSNLQHFLVDSPLLQEVGVMLITVLKLKLFSCGCHSV